MSKKKKKFFRQEKTTQLDQVNDSQSALISDSNQDQRKSAPKETRFSILSLRAMEYFWLAIIVLVPLFFWSDFSIILIKETVFETLVLLMGFFWLVRLLEIKKLEFNLNFFTITLGIFFLLIIVSTVFSPDQDLSFWGSPERGQGLKAFIFYFFFFLILASSLKTEKQVQKIFTTLIWVTVILAVYGILQYFRIDPFPEHYQFVTSQDQTRVYSTFGNPVFFAAWLAMVIPLLVYKIYVIINQHRFRKKFTLLIYSLVTLLLLITLLLTQTRGAILALLISGLVIFIFIAIIKKIKWFWITALLSFILIASCLVSLNIESNPLKIPKDHFITQRFSNMFAETSSFHSRLVIWKMLIKPVSDRLVLGFGPDSFESFSLSKDYFNKDMLKLGVAEARTNRAHNLILDYLLFFGILGTAVFFLAIFNLVYQLVKKILIRDSQAKKLFLLIAVLTSLLIYFLQNLVSFSETNLYLFFFLLLALAYFYLFSPFQQLEVDRQVIEKKVWKGRNRSGIIYLLILVVWVGIWYFFIFQPVQAEFYYQQGSRLIKKPETLEQGKGFLQKAWQINSRDYNHMLALFDVLTQNPQDYEQLKSFLQKAYQQRPEEVTYPYLLARLYSLMGKEDSDKLEQAKDILDQSLENYGYQVVFYMEYIRQLSDEKRFDKVEEKIKQAIVNTAPIEAEYYLAAAQSAIVQKEYDQAIRFLTLDEEKGGLASSTQRYYFLGIVYHQKEEYQQAGEAWKKCVETNPRNIDCLRALVINYRNQEKYDQAQEYAQKIQKIDDKLGSKMLREIEEAQSGQ